MVHLEGKNRRLRNEDQEPKGFDQCRGTYYILSQEEKTADNIAPEDKTP
jgi:hypothetical protein